MQKKLLVLITQSLWLTPEQRRTLQHAVNTGQLDEAQQQELNTLLSKAKDQQQTAELQFFKQHPELIRGFIQKLNKIGKNIWKEAESFYQTNTQEQSIASIEDELNKI